MEMTQRVFKGISGMILMLAIGIGTLNEAAAQCTVNIFVTQNPSTCYSQVTIAATASDPVQEWSYYIDGQLVSNGSSVILNLEPGTYQAYVGITTDQGCIATDLTTFTIDGNILQVDAGTDLLLCQEQAVLSANVTATNPYSVQWTPAGLLENPTSASTLITQNVYNQWFIVDVIDAVTGCISSDTITVTQQNPLFDTLDLCNGSAIIDLGPGANSYQWLSWTDTAGNNFPLNYPTSQQSITATEPGQYFMYADFPDCGALTSLVTVEACPPTCFNAFAQTVTTDQCGDIYSFVSTGTAQITSWSWDFGDGATSSFPNPFHVFTTGTYEVSLTTVNSDGCTAVSSQTFTSNNGVSLTMSSDTVACQEAAYMEVFPIGGSGDYSYSWTPTQGVFSDPTQPIYYVEGVHNEIYYAYVTDNVTGCFAYDSVTVSSYVAHNETLQLCNDSVFFSLGPGASFYNLAPISFDQQQYYGWIDTPGQYVFYGQFPGCGAITSQITVEECSTACSATISNDGLNYQYCGATIDLNATYSSPIDSAIWNLGNGDVVFDNGSGIPPQFYSGGSYIVQLTAYHTGGCVSTTSYSIILLTDIDVQINVGDTVACAGQLFVSAAATGGGGQYAYYWPISGNTTPSAVISVTQNQWVTVEVTDTYTGCTAYDSVYVYANQQINQTIEMCVPTVTLEVDPGSLIYNWTYTDEFGNITQFPEQTNQLEAVSLGTYTCFTYSSGCLSVQHTFEVILCPTVCYSDFIAVSNPQQCGSLYDFAGQNFSHPVDSVVWNYGDGTTYTDDGVGETHFFPAGSYLVTMVAYHTSGCASTAAQIISVNSGVTIELTEDTVACNGMLQLNHTISGGSGGYIYQWYPQAAMNSPTAPFPTMTVTTDGWVEVHLEDTQTGCTAIDSMYVYANTAINDTLQLCGDSVFLAVNPGSLVYNWSYTDEFGNTGQVQNFDYELLADAIGTYICFTYYSGCNTVIHSFVVEDCAAQNDDVWPGDANSDGIVTNSDALYLGLAFNQTGPNRPAATLNWVGQPCPDWTFNFVVNNVNLKHADCDGNGIINFDDTLAIDFNYLNTHNKFEGVSASGNPPIWVEATPDTVGLEQAIDIVVHIGTALQPIDSMHGVAFTLTFDESKLSQNGLSIDFDNCVLGTAGSDVLTFQKNQFINGAIDFAVTRNTLQNFQGFGPIVHARLVTTDNLSGVHSVAFGIDGVVALTASETLIDLSTIPDTVVIDPNKVGMEEQQLANVMVYPNPATDILNVTGLKGTGSITVVNTLGQEMTSISFQGSDRVQLDLTELNSGVYFIRIKSETGIVTRKLRLIQS